MEKELVFTERYPVRHDDLKFDGNHILIPSNWSESLFEFLDRVDISKLEEGDKEDYNTLYNFVNNVSRYKRKNTKPATYQFEGTN